MSKLSISAHNAFRRCQKQYYFAHIAAHHSARDPLRREAYVLKQLKDLKRWQGSLVDLGIQRFVIEALNNGQTVSPEKVISQTIELAKGQFEFSTNQFYRLRENAKSKIGDTFCGLFEHEYGIAISENALCAVFQIVERSLSNLFEISFPGKQSQYKIIDIIRQASWRVANLQNLSFSVDEIRITPQIDLALFIKNRPVVIDWKVAENSASDYSKQLLICGLAMLAKWPKYKPEEVVLFEVNLLKRQIKQYKLTAEKVLEIEDFLHESSLDINCLTGNRKYSDINLEEFDFANSPFTCQWCNFSKICKANMHKEQ